MCGIEDGAACHTVLAGLVNQHFHHLMTGHHTQAVMSIHNERRRGLFYEFDLCFRKKRSVFDTVEINRFKAVAAMALNAAPVTFQKDIRADCSVFPRHTIFLKYIHHEIIHEFPIHIRSCLCHISSLLKRCIYAIIICRCIYTLTGFVSIILCLR